MENKLYEAVKAEALLMCVCVHVALHAGATLVCVFPICKNSKIPKHFSEDHLVLSSSIFFSTQDVVELFGGGGGGGGKFTD